MSDIAPGKYVAVITDYGVSASKAGDPMITVQFSFDNGKSLFWNGSLKEKAQEITLKALLRMGLRDEERLADLADGLDSKLLDTTKQLEIDVGMDTYEGKTKPRINWVNDLGGGKFRNAMDKNNFKVKIAGLNLKTTIKALKFEMGLSDTSQIENIPF